MNRVAMRMMAATAAMLVVATEARAADPKQAPPFYASIQAGRARMRTGPARAYPASWLYQRADLPIKVVAIFKEWRKVEDHEGASGWMLANLISSRRTAIVVAERPVEMLDRPAPGAALAWRAAPGVVGRVSECGDGWCRFDVKGRAGYVRVAGLWGVEPGERVP